VVCRYTDGAVAARWFGQERGVCRWTMRRRCGGRELDDHAEAGDLAVALEARPDDRAVEKGGPDAWATAGPRCDPLLAPRRDGVEFVGSSGKTNGWDASTSAKSERDGDGVWMMKALGFRREVGHMATSGLAGVPETSRGKVWRFLQNRPRTRFRQFSQNCPREDSRRTRCDIRGIASGRSKLLQVVAAVGWSSMYLFLFCP